MIRNYAGKSPLAMGLGGPLLLVGALGCAQPVDTEGGSTVETAAQAIATAQGVAAIAATATPSFACKIGGTPIVGAGAAAAMLAAEPVRPVDDQYRAPSKDKPPPDIAAQRTPAAALMAALPDPDSVERQARYERALAELEKKHPRRDEAFERARMQLKMRIISDMGSE